MHGLKTIVESHQLAYDNANAARTLKEADTRAALEGRNPLAELAAEAAARRAERRQKVIDDLVAKTDEELLDYVDGLEAPTTLEVALAIKLRKYAAFRLAAEALSKD